MRIETKFDIGQEVFIKHNSFQACWIDQIKVEGKNMFYHAFYWLNGKLETIDLSEDELVSELPKKEIGI